MAKWDPLSYIYKKEVVDNNATSQLRDSLAKRKDKDMN